MISSEQVLTDVQAGIAVLAAARMVQLSIVARQPAMFAFMAATAGSMLALSFFRVQSNAYFWGYIFTQGPVDTISIAVVRELFSTIVSDYPGIQTAARWVMNTAIILSVLGSAILTAISWNAGAANRGHLYYALVLHRSVDSGLAVIVVSLLLFLSKYPRRLQKNTYISSYFFSALVLIEAAVILITTLSRTLSSQRIGLPSLIAGNLCFVAWACAIRKEETLPPKRKTRTPQEELFLERLESLNRTLSRAGRR